MELTQEALRAEIKNGPAGPYFLYGNEEYLKNFYAGRLRAHTIKGAEDFAEWNTREIETDGDNLKIPDLEEALSAVPMMGDKVFVLYTVKLSPPKEKESKGAKGKGSGFNDRVEEMLDAVRATDASLVCLVAVAPDGAFDAGDLSKGRPTALYKKLESVFTMVALNTPTPREIGDWLQRRAKHDGVTVSPEAADYYKTRAEIGMFALGGELDKAICFAKANGRDVIDMELVSEITSLTDVSEQYGLSNAIVNGDRRKALRELNLSKKRAEAPQMVFGGIISNVSLMLSVKAMSDEGMQAKEIADRLKLNSYRVSKILEGVRNTEYGKIKGAMTRLIEADRARKSTGLDDVLALERFICTIPSGRK